MRKWKRLFRLINLFISFPFIICINNRRWRFKLDFLCLVGGRPCSILVWKNIRWKEDLIYELFFKLFTSLIKSLSFFHLFFRVQCSIWEYDHLQSRIREIQSNHPPLRPLWCLIFDFTSLRFWSSHFFTFHPTQFYIWNIISHLPLHFLKYPFLKSISFFSSLLCFLGCLGEGFIGQNHLARRGFKYPTFFSSWGRTNLLKTIHVPWYWDYGGEDSCECEEI